MLAFISHYSTNSFFLLLWCGNIQHLQSVPFISILSSSPFSLKFTFPYVAWLRKYRIFLQFACISWLFFPTSKCFFPLEIIFFPTESFSKHSLMSQIAIENQLCFFYFHNITKIILIFLASMIYLRATISFTVFAFGCSLAKKKWNDSDIFIFVFTSTTFTAVNKQSNGENWKNSNDVIFIFFFYSFFLSRKITFKSFLLNNIYLANFQVFYFPSSLIFNVSLLTFL